MFGASLNICINYNVGSVDISGLTSNRLVKYNAFQIYIF